METQKPVRTRFAPSPTGYLHIGGVRTALFNWLFAKKHGGQFILRIDDTDQERNVAEAIAPILAGFRWLGIHWDEGPEVGGNFGPYYQSQKTERYQAVVRELVDRGLAYYDYATTEEIKAERDAAEKAKRPFLYSRRFMAETDSDRRRFESDGRKGVVRLKMPREGACRFTDHVRGEMKVDWISEQDHVIQRADGSVLYNLANIVDDHDIEITHVIRAEEHLSNTPRQLFMIDGLGYQRPEYAHVPFVAEPGSKNKLSKRKLDQYLKNPDFKKIYEHGLAIAQAIGQKPSADTFNPVIVDFYTEVGYLPDAIINYLLLLGWSLDDKTEFFTRDEMIRSFSLDRVNKAPASFDPKKLLAFEERYMRELPFDEKAKLTIPYLEQAGFISTPAADDNCNTIHQIVAAAADRIVVAGDILNYTDFFLPDDHLVYDEKAIDKKIRKDPESIPWLKKFRDELATAEPFTAESLERRLHAFAEFAGINIAQLIHPLRLALTGKSIGFGLFDTLAILGRDRSVNRIDQLIERMG